MTDQEKNSDGKHCRPAVENSLWVCVCGGGGGGVKVHTLLAVQLDSFHFGQVGFIL